MIYVFLKLGIRQLVAVLVFAIESAIFLNSVVGKMDHFVTDVLNVISVWRRSNVALAKPVGSHNSMHSCYQHVMSNIELATLVKQRLLYVFLNDICFVHTIWVLLFFLKNIVQLIKRIDDYYSVSSIGKLSRLDYPYVTLFFWLFLMIRFLNKFEFT